MAEVKNFCVLQPSKVAEPARPKVKGKPVVTAPSEANSLGVASSQVLITVASTEKGTDKDDLNIELIKAGGQIISAAAWPIAVAFLVWILRKEIAKFLARVRKVKFGDLEASVEEEIENLGSPPQQAPEDDASNLGFAVNDLSQRAPIDAIVTAWVGVERAVEQFIQRVKPSNTPPGARPHRGGAFSRTALLLMPPDLRGIFGELRHIRNRVVHEADVNISPDAVRLYVEQAAWIVNRLNEIQETQI